jgi:hypothetical protein
VTIERDRCNGIGAFFTAPGQEGGGDGSRGEDKVQSDKP